MGFRLQGLGYYRIPGTCASTDACLRSEILGLESSKLKAPCMSGTEW